MCGLVGILGDITHAAQTNVFKDMLEVCQVRGRDSTGVIKVDKNKDYDWCKQVGPPSVLYESRQYENRIDKGPCIALIGHTRSKTIGDVSIKNAHPFDFEDEGICGVHNGTLRSYYDLEGHAHNKVDSEILYNHLAVHGVEDTFSRLVGAWACVWWNDKDKTVNFIRNDQRPLWFTWSKDFKMMFWASEIWMFGVVERKIDLWDGGEDKKKYISLPVNTLWSFGINTQAKGDEKAIVMRPAKEIAQAEEKKAFSNGTRNFHGNNWKQTGPNTFEREDETPAAKSGNDDKKGGEVTNPFLLNRELEKQRMRRLFASQAELDNNECILEDLTNSPLSNVTFLNHSALSSRLPMRAPTTTRSKRNLLSLPAKSSSPYPIKDNVDVSGDIRKSSSKSTTASLNLMKGVSFRVVAGIVYITNNKDSSEYSEMEFQVNTNGICCFCKHPTDMMNVGEILDKKNFICEVCLDEPKGQLIAL